MRKLLLSLILACICVFAQAYSFSAVNSDGVTIYYNILSSADLTCEVTYKTTSYNSYSGSVVIPSAVNYNGKEYCVTSIGEKAFYNCSSLITLKLPEKIGTIGSNALKSNSIIVMAYATAEGYEQSAAVIKSFPFDATVNDINGDNKITIADVTTLIDIIVNQ